MGGPGSGSRRPDTLAVHNGADDNASGTAAIMEIIERLAAMQPHPRRSIVFASFSAEEMGLLGSKEFVNHPPVDLSKVQAMVNLDMVGRLDPKTHGISIGGVGTAKGLEDRVRKYTEQHGLHATFSQEGYGPSDHASFYTKDIPVLFFFTGINEDYHTPDDDADRINYEGEKQVADCVADIVADLANGDERLAFTEAGPKQPKEGRRRFKVTLGIMPDVTGGDGSGLRVDAVMDGRPAKVAGMLKGDVIVSMEGKSVTNIYDYMARLSECKSGQRISVEVRRGDEVKVLIVQL
jgi:hypothetical protein